MLVMFFPDGCFLSSNVLHWLHCSPVLRLHKLGRTYLNLMELSAKEDIRTY